MSKTKLFSSLLFLLSSHTTLADEKIGFPSCWGGEHSEETCCYPLETGGNSACWYKEYRFDYCCGHLAKAVREETCTMNSKGISNLLEVKTFLKTQNGKKLLSKAKFYFLKTLFFQIV